MNDEYLWDSRNRPVDPFVAELEQALVKKRYQPRDLDEAVALPSAGRRWGWPTIAGATLLTSAAAAAALWFVFATAPTDADAPVEPIPSEFITNDLDERTDEPEADIRSKVIPSSAEAVKVK